MNDNVDPEILYAAALGVQLAQMRAELDESAIKRILIFVLDRYGVVHGQLYINTMQKVRIVEHPTVRDVFPDAAPDVEPSTHALAFSEKCPMCGKAAINLKGLSLHMYRAHGTSWKEYQRTIALDTKAGT